MRFPTDTKFVDGAFRSVFGYAVPHNGRIYCACNECTSLAIRRLTGVRKPDTPGLHEQLFTNQKELIEDDQFKPFKERLKEKYFKHLSPVFDPVHEAIEHHADPHQKRELRIQAFKDLVNKGWLGDPDHIWLRKSIWKMKRLEWAKHGKKPRMIVDLGTPASLLGFIAMERLKQAQSQEDLEINGGILHFCKSPDPFEMQRIFQELYSPSKRFYFVYFSDDACLAIRDGDRILRYNLDISSCDASHSPALFTLLRDIFPTNSQPLVDRLIQQCQSRLCIRATQDRNMKVILQPTRPMLYSGSTITTAINNLANILIAFKISQLTAFTPSDIEKAAAAAGYIVTGTEPLEHFEDLQFLKHSPVFDKFDNIHPLLNLGVLLRASGTTHGDLPGHGPFQARADAYQAALLNGMYPRATFQLIRNMKATVSHAKPSKLNSGDVLSLAHKVVDSDYPVFEPTARSLYLRYRLDDGEISALERGFGSAGYACFFNHSSASKILEKDYGLKCTDYEALENNRGFEDSYT